MNYVIGIHRRGIMDAEQYYKLNANSDNVQSPANQQNYEDVKCQDLRSLLLFTQLKTYEMPRLAIFTLVHNMEDVHMPRLAIFTLVHKLETHCKLIEQLMETCQGLR